MVTCSRDFFAGGERELQGFDQRLDVEHRARLILTAHVHACAIDQQRDRAGDDPAARWFRR